MKISNCRCGRKAVFDSEGAGPSGVFVYCTRGMGGGYMNTCWVGPSRKTEREAIESWNKIMGGKK
jgi:hypothetical protein